MVLEVLVEALLVVQQQLPLLVVVLGLRLPQGHRARVLALQALRRAPLQQPQVLLGSQVLRPQPLGAQVLAEVLHGQVGPVRLRPG